MRRRELLLAAALFSLTRTRVAAGQDNQDDTIARWLAGTAPLPGLEPTGEWLAYAAAEDAHWARAMLRIRAMQDWAQRELLPTLPRERPVLYPFGGPDALHALTLFDDASHVVLIGLEPALALPDATRPPHAGYFPCLGAALADLHRLTFFRTRELESDVARVGVLPPLLATLVRLGGRVTRVTEPMDGKVTFEWVSSDGRPRRLDYAQVDLSNASLARHTEFVAMLRALAPHVTFIKSASYLLVEDRFSYVRRLLLEGSAAIVQDDTGIPFCDLDRRWATRLFGRYVGPREPFLDRAQPDLEAAFARKPVSPLPFGIGYHVDPRSSNLLLGVRGSR